MIIIVVGFFPFDIGKAYSVKTHFSPYLFFFLLPSFSVTRLPGGFPLFVTLHSSVILNIINHLLRTFIRLRVFFSAFFLFISLYSGTMHALPETIKMISYILKFFIYSDHSILTNLVHRLFSQTLFRKIKLKKKQYLRLIKAESETPFRKMRLKKVVFYEFKKNSWHLSAH